MAYFGSVLSAIMTYGMKKHPIPPIPSTILSRPKKIVEAMKGEIIPADPTNNVEIKNADLLPQRSAMIPSMNAPSSMPTIYNELKIPFK